jgi:xylulokinase
VAGLSAAAAGVPAGASGLLVLPYFAGERSPLFDPGARGVVAGLRLDHGGPQLMRAIYEATAMSVRHVLTRFAAAASAGEPGDGPAWRVVAAGGGTKSETWMQIVSDVTGEAQIVPSQTIGASYGDALLAAEAAGLVPPGTDWTRVAETVEPNPELAGVYDTLFSAYLELYPATRDVIGRLQ